MVFNKEDFTRVELPKPPSNNEVTFNTDGKITLSKDLSYSFVSVKGLGLDADGYGANIYQKQETVEVEGKKPKVKQYLYLEFVPYGDDVDCKCNYLTSQGRFRVNATQYLKHLDIKTKGQKYGNNAITVVITEHTSGILIDLSKRPLTKRKTKPKSKTTVSAPAGEQATPKTQQKSTKIVESPTGALQMQ